MSTTYDCVHYGRGRMRPCIYGPAAGDAPGVPCEFSGRGTFECTGMAGDGTHGQYAGCVPAEMGRPAARQGSNRAMHLGERR